MLPKYAVFVIYLGFYGFLTVPINAEECKWTDWSKENKPCPGNAAEIYKDVMYGQNRQMCCTGFDSDALKNIKVEQNGCRISECKPGHVENPCNGEKERWVDGKRYPYEEMFEDSCTVKNAGGATGTVSYCCPKDSLESSLVSTLGAEPNEFPHIARLVLPGDGKCGGTIYNDRWILTAAHCIISDGEVDPTPMTVVLGTNLAGMEGDEYIYKVSQKIPHPDYSKLSTADEFQTQPMGFPRTFNDIALLKLDRKIQFSDKIKAIEIAPTGFDPFNYADHLVIAGWGTTDTGAMSAHLQKGNLRLRSDHTCFTEGKGFAAYTDWYDGLEDKLLCVGGERDGTWSAKSGRGDSGGPAICRKENGQAILCGVTSFSSEGQPSVYAEVPTYFDWIQKTAGPQNPKNFFRAYLYGKKVENGEYDHQVHITSSTGKPCGGTLIKPDILVTSGACIMRADGSGQTHSGIRIHYGIKDVTSGAGKTFKVKSLMIGPEFPKNKKPIDIKKQGNRVIIADDYFKDDLAIVKLDGKAPVKQHQLPVLPEFQDQFYDGTEIAFPRNSTISGELRSREYKLIEYSECQKRMNRMKKLGVNTKVDQKLICGVEKYSGGSLCDRELGGGLICKKGNQNVLCGIQTFRLCEFTIPNGFLNMGIYSGFVKQAMEQLK